MEWFVVAIGGAVGACFRYALSLAFLSSGVRFPTATFICNGLGCFLMGVGFVYIVEKGVLAEYWRHLLLIGFLGAFTTFSTFSIESLSLLSDQLYRIAAIYIFGTLLVSVMAAFAGMSVAKYL